MESTKTNVPAIRRASSRVTIVVITLTSDSIAIRQGWEVAKEVQMIVVVNIDPDYATMFGDAAMAGCEEIGVDASDSIVSALLGE